DGAPMLQHILDISQGLFAKRIVVTRHKEVAEICAQQQIPCLLHDKPYLSDTVRLGTSYIKQQLPQAEGLLFAVADQPLLQQASLIRLAESFLAQPQKIHRLYHESTPGNPIIFPAKFANELQQLPQDKGGSVLTKKHPELVVKVPVQDINELLDIDTQQDKAKLERLRPYSE
ncbi:nucleotidyltransferase family protein, partial [Phascolarctobacterium succinatutens]|uniref:nucleotidyltransferase family protein n=1 Tax=Phascolarctobacterium succinatutens TaxID=626940 RepID=UPI003A92ED73